MHQSVWITNRLQNPVQSFWRDHVIIRNRRKGPSGYSTKHVHSSVASAKEGSWEGGLSADFKIPGLAEFAAGVMERKKHIPSPKNQDPLLKLFDEFDLDHDGELTPLEVCKALQSRQVGITEEQAKFFIQAVEDGDKKSNATRNAFPELVLHMASTYVPPAEDAHNRYSIS